MGDNIEREAVLPPISVFSGEDWFNPHYDVSRQVSFEQVSIIKKLFGGEDLAVTLIDDDFALIRKSDGGSQRLLPMDTERDGRNALAWMKSLDPKITELEKSEIVKRVIKKWPAIDDGYVSGEMTTHGSFMPSVCSLRLTKSRFANVGDAASWVEERDFSSEMMIEVAGEWIFWQDSELPLMTVEKTIEDGVVAIVTTEEGFERTIPFSKINEEERTVEGIVYEPNVLDSERDWMSADDIQEMAWNFLKSCNQSNVDIEHDEFARNGLYVVESFIAKVDDQHYPAGAWIVKCQILNDNIWNAVKKGYLNGFSMGGVSQVLDGATPPSFGFLKSSEETKIQKKVAPCYVSRKLLNADELVKWAKSQGFSTTVPPEKMHVTVLYSKVAFDWFKVEEDWATFDGKMTIAAGGPREVVELGPEGAVVLRFQARALEYRHDEMVEAGASHDYDTFKAHVTFTYEPGEVDLSKVEPYNGKLEFGPEIFAEIDDGWKDKLVEKSLTPPEKKPHGQLKKVRVDFISLVGKGANGRDWKFRKSAEKNDFIVYSSPSIRLLEKSDSKNHSKGFLSWAFEGLSSLFETKHSHPGSVVAPVTRKVEKVQKNTATFLNLVATLAKRAGDSEAILLKLAKSDPFSEVVKSDVELQKALAGLKPVELQKFAGEAAMFLKQAGNNDVSLPSMENFFGFVQSLEDPSRFLSGNMPGGGDSPGTFAAGAGQALAKTGVSPEGLANQDPSTLNNSETDAAVASEESEVDKACKDKQKACTPPAQDESMKKMQEFMGVFAKSVQEMLSPMAKAMQGLQADMETVKKSQTAPAASAPEQTPSLDASEEPAANGLIIGNASPDDIDINKADSQAQFPFSDVGFLVNGINFETGDGQQSGSLGLDLSTSRQRSK